MNEKMKTVAGFVLAAMLLTSTVGCKPQVRLSVGEKTETTTVETSTSGGEESKPTVTETPTDTSASGSTETPETSATPTVTETPTDPPISTETPTDTPVTPTETPTDTPVTPTETPPVTTDTPTPRVGVSGITLESKTLSGVVGDKVKLVAHVLPENATNQNVTFASSDPSVVVCAGEELSFVGVGSATVTVTTEEEGYVARCTVTVKSAEIRPNDVRYGENGLPNYQPTFEEDVEYEDFKAVNVLHLFCHDLVAFKDEQEYFYGDCITVTEFNRILEQLYARNFVLIDVDYMYDYAYDADGNMTATIKNTIKVPKGKKPIILSVDNVAFPRSEHGYGRADRLEVVNGRLVTYTKMPDGSDRYSEEDEVFPILENFIAAHPDFSFSGAKCIVAPAGYEGLFGWDTIPGSANYEQNVKKAREVAQWLVDHGFAFACHSYSHSDFAKLTVSQIDADMQKWKAEVAPIIGKTHIFIYPFGSFTPKNNERGKALMKHGYSVYCSTSMGGVNWNNFPETGNAYNERITLASKLLVTYKDNELLNSLIDPYTVYDNDAHSKKLKREG